MSHNKKPEAYSIILRYRAVILNLFVILYINKLETQNTEYFASSTANCTEK